MAEPRIIRKYPNRRLYDLTESRYVTLWELRKMVTLGVDFVVVDKLTGEDVTRPVLLRVITAFEQSRVGFLSQEFLLQVIRSQEHVSQGLLTASYLEQSLNLLKDRDEPLDSGCAANDEAAEEMAQRLAQKHYQTWRAVQDQICLKLTG